MNYRLVVTLAMVSGLLACQQQADQQKIGNSTDAATTQAEAVSAWKP